MADEDPDHERDDNRENREHPHVLALTTQCVIGSDFSLKLHGSKVLGDQSGGSTSG